MEIELKDGEGEEESRVVRQDLAPGMFNFTGEPVNLLVSQDYVNNSVKLVMHYTCQGLTLTFIFLSDRLYCKI